MDNQHPHTPRTTRTHHQHRMALETNQHPHHTRQPHQHQPHRRRNPHPQRLHHPNHHPHMTKQNPLTNLNKKQPNTPKPTDTHTKPPTNNNWMKKANCRGQTHLMFPKHHKDITYIQQAKQICTTCPVKTQCLNYALQYPPADMHGVWAGHTSRQLANKQKKLGIKPTKPTIAKTWGETQ
jgi:WhiB family redox-sensing transcriptional regulator